MNNYIVIITFLDGTTYVWEGAAKTQYRAELLAMRLMRMVIDQPIVKIETKEQS